MSRHLPMILNLAIVIIDNYTAGHPRAGAAMRGSTPPWKERGAVRLKLFERFKLSQLPLIINYQLSTFCRSAVTISCYSCVW